MLLFNNVRLPDTAEYASLRFAPITGTVELIKSFAPLVVTVSTEFVKIPFNERNDIKNDETIARHFVTKFLIYSDNDLRSISLETQFEREIA